MDFTEKLPLEILEEIFLFLDSNDLIRCSRVSYRWREIINCNKIWSRRCTLEKILHKPYLKKEDSFFLNPTKMYRTVDSVSPRLTPTCPWRSHFNRYLYVKQNWKRGHYTMERTKVKTSHYKEGMLINIDEAGISIHLIPQKNALPYYIEKKYMYDVVDNVLIKDNYIAYTQSRYVVCYKKRKDDVFNLVYEFEVEEKECHTTRNRAEKILTAAVTDKFFFIQDNYNPCFFRFYHWTKGTLEREKNVHKALSLVENSCLHFSCIEAFEDKIYVSYTLSSKHLISQYNYTTDKWGPTFETHFRAFELFTSNNFLCAKNSGIAFEKSCELNVWSLHTRHEVALFCTSKNLPIILTNDNKIIFSEHETIFVRGLVTSFEKDMYMSSRLENMCLVWDKMLLVNLGSAIQLWDWYTGERLQTFLRDAISNVWADDKLIVVSISRFVNSYSPAGGYIFAFW